MTAPRCRTPEPTYSFDTPAGRIEMRRATLQDIGTIARVMLDAAQTPRSRGLRMWSWLDEPQRCEQLLRKRVEEDDFYLAILRGGSGAGDGGGGAAAPRAEEPIGTIRIAWSDPECWDERGNDGLAGYVHGLA